MTPGHCGRAQSLPPTPTSSIHDSTAYGLGPIGQPHQLLLVRNTHNGARSHSPSLAPTALNGVAHIQFELKLLEVEESKDQRKHEQSRWAHQNGCNKHDKKMKVLDQKHAEKMEMMDLQHAEKMKMMDHQHAKNMAKISAPISPEAVENRNKESNTSNTYTWVGALAAVLHMIGDGAYRQASRGFGAALGWIAKLLWLWVMALGLAPDEQTTTLRRLSG